MGALVVTIASVLITVGAMKTVFKGDGGGAAASARAKQPDDTRTVTNALYGAYDQGAGGQQQGYLDVGQGGDSTYDSTPNSWDAGQNNGNNNDLYTDAPTWGENNAPAESSFKRAGFQKDGDSSFRQASVYRANPLQADDLDAEEDDGSGGITVDVGSANNDGEADGTVYSEFKMNADPMGRQNSGNYGFSGGGDSAENAETETFDSFNNSDGNGNDQEDVGGFTEF